MIWKSHVQSIEKFDTCDFFLTEEKFIQIFLRNNKRFFFLLYKSRIVIIFSMLSRFTDPDLLKNMESEENFRFLNLSSSSALAALHGLVADNCILARHQFVFGQICTIYVSADLHAVQNHRDISYDNI